MSYMNELAIVDMRSEDEYTRGWFDADRAITLGLSGQDLSQGDTEWDRGWNTRIEMEKK